MATVRRRGDKWQVQVRRQGFAGLTRSFAMMRDAERWGVLKEREFDLLESQGLIGKKVCDLTLAAILARYRETLVPHRRGGDREAYMIKAMERATFAAAMADRVTSADLKAYRDTRLRTVSPATVVRELGLLQHAYEIARKDWGYEGLGNPVKDVSKPKLPPGRARRLSDGEEGLLIHWGRLSRNPLLLPIMGFALETGMRLGEIVAADWKHYDGRERVLLVPLTKNGKPRTVPLTLKAASLIEGRRGSDVGPIFPSTVEAIKQAWIRLTRRAGIADLHFHDLRHEAVSRLFERGLDMPEVMMVSGHTDHRMLLRYTHLSARKLVEKMDRSERCAQQAEAVAHAR